MNSIFFDGSISGEMLCIGRLREGDKVLIGSIVRGCGVADDTRIWQQISGPIGGPGVYLVTEIQTVSGVTLEACSPDNDKQIIADLVRTLNAINKQIFATGAPLGTEVYFKIRGLAVDAILRAGGKVK